MAVRGSSNVQRFFTRFVDDRTAAAMEAHSRAWLLTCPHCGSQRSVWDMGGIRYKASGHEGLRVRCQQCGETGWHVLVRAADFPQTAVSSWPIVRLVILLVLAIWAVVAAVVFGILRVTGVV